MTERTTTQLMDSYDELDSHEQLIIRLLAVIYEPVNQTTVNNILDNLGLSPLQIAPTAVNKAIRSRLKRKGLIFIDRTGKMRCSLELLTLMAFESVQRGEFPELHYQALQVVPIREFNQYGYNTSSLYVSEASYQLVNERKLFYAVFSGDSEGFLKCLNITDPYEEPQPPYQDRLIDVCASPIYPPVLKSWLPQIQYHVLRPIIQACLVNWENLTLFPMLKNAVNSDASSMLNFVYAEQCLVRGEWQTVNQFLPHLNNQQSHALHASMLFLQGDRDGALVAFEQAIKGIRKATGKRNVTLPGITCLLHLMALLSNRTPGKSRLIEQQIKFMLKQESSIYLGAIHKIDYAWKVQTGKLKFSPDYLSDFIPGLSTDYLPDNFTLIFADDLSVLLICLTYYWNDSIPDDSFLLYLKSNRSKAEKGGYQWFARECDCLLSAVENKATENKAVEDSIWGPPLTELLPRFTTWERSLQALVNLPSTDSNGVLVEKRIVWLLDPNYGLFYLKPKEQKRNKNGSWSAGREVALRRLAEDPDAFTLSEADKKICRSIETFRTPVYYRKRFEYELEGQAAMLAAVDHPHIYGLDKRHIEIKQGEPELIVSEQGQSILLSIEPHPGDLLFRVIEETPEKFLVYEYSDALLHIATTLTPKGLSVPGEARDKVLESVSSIAPLLTVHSNIDGMTDSAASHVDADRRLYVHIRPSGEGLRLGFYVQPFGAGPLLKPGHGGERLFAEVNGKPLTTTRDLAAEKVLFNSVVNASDRLYEASPDEWCWSEAEDALEGLLTLKSMQEDLVLQWPEGKEIKLTPVTGSSKMSVSLRKRTDWFEIDGELKVDERQVYSMQGLLELVNSSNGRFIPLGEGEFLTLTDKLRRQLEVISQIEHKSRIHGLNVQNVEDSIDGMTVDLDEGWEQQVSRLQAARDIDPQVPSTVEAELRDYQQQGYKWLCRLAEWGAGACLADDMGLGKTLQSLALLVNRAAGGPALVLAPTSVCANWIEEAHRFTPTLNPIRFGTGNREATLEALGPYDVLICSYGLLQTESEALTAKHWHSVVADEAQAFKNAATKRSRAVMALVADFKMIATGTPLENHLGELWNLFRFINPGLLGTHEMFNQKFAYPIENLKDKVKAEGLRRQISPFILRRLKRDVLTELPPLTEITVHVELSDRESALYEALRLEAVDQLSKVDLKPFEQKIRALASITRLRRAVCNPNLVMQNANLPSAKLEAFASIVDELLENRHKALVFSQFTGHLALIRQFLDGRGITYQYLDGSTPFRKRKQEIDAFQAGESELFLISLKAGGVGLNLTAADYVIHMDPWWNPAVEDQASDRAHRIGQTRPVTVYRLVATGTIEEKIVNLHSQKRDLADSLLEGTEVSARMSVDDMLALIDQP